MLIMVLLGKHIIVSAIEHHAVFEPVMHLKKEGFYLLVGVKYLNGEGFITTAFLTRKIIRKI